MNISLTPHLEKLVSQKVASGLYNSASEVIREALRLLEEQDRMRQLKLETLRREIRVGLEQEASGDLLSAEEVFGRLREENKQARKARARR